MNIDELFRELKKLNINLSAREICQIWGMDEAAFCRKKKAGTEIKQKNISQLEYALDISLTFGKVEKVEKSKRECINIPVKGEVHASMGYGITVYDESTTATYGISKQLANDLNINLSTSEIIFGSGNSMSPTIQGGDSLLIDKSRREINDGKIYCIRYDGQLLTKRLQKLSKTRIKLISDNKDYEPVIIDFTEDLDFEIIGEVRWSGRVFK